MSAMSELDLLRTEARAALNKWTAAQKLWERLETAGEAPAEEYAAGETMAGILRSFLQFTDQAAQANRYNNRDTFCRHCGHKITPTEFGTWQDADHPGCEVCDLADDYGPSHEPQLPQTCEMDGYESTGDQGGERYWHCENPAAWHVTDRTGLAPHHLLMCSEHAEEYGDKTPLHIHDDDGTVEGCPGCFPGPGPFHLGQPWEAEKGGI